MTQYEIRFPPDVKDGKVFFVIDDKFFDTASVNAMLEFYRNLGYTVTNLTLFKVVIVRKNGNQQTVNLTKPEILAYEALGVRIMSPEQFEKEFGEKPPELIDDPLDEDPIIPPEMDGDIPPDAVTIVLNPKSTYTPSTTPMMGRVNLFVLSRLAHPEAVIKAPVLFIQVNDDKGNNIKNENFNIDPRGIVFSNEFIFDVDTKESKLDIFVTMFEGGTLPISKGARIELTYNAGLPPPSGGGGGAQQISPIMPIVGAGAAIAFLSGMLPSKKKRRR